MSMKIAVVGAGISGLSTAFMLSGDRSREITIFAADFSPNLTSNRAAAFWFPYHIRNDRRGIEWCQTSYHYYKMLAEEPASGINMKTLVTVVRKGVKEEDSVWLEFMPEGSVISKERSLLNSAYAKEYRISVPLIETQLFLPFLQQKLTGSGVRFVPRKVEKLQDLTTHFDVVINCTALGSRLLCGDRELIPVRGQVVLMEPGEPDEIFLDNEKPLYVVPRRDATLIGGTYEEGVETAETETRALNVITAHFYETFPQYRGRAVIGSWAGLRPFRKEVRVERESGTLILHNYGHGGSGFTLAFGCAAEIKKLVESI